MVGLPVPWKPHRLTLLHRRQLSRVPAIRIPLPEIDRARAIHIEIVSMDKGLGRLIKRLKNSIDISRLTPTRSANYLFRLSVQY